MNAASESAQRASLLAEAVAHYHELLDDADLAGASYQTLHDGLEHNRLIFGGRAAFALSASAFHNRV